MDLSQFKESGLKGLLQKSENISTLGDSIGGVTSYYGRKNRKKAHAARLQQEALDAQTKKDFETKMAAYEKNKAAVDVAWNAKKAQLEQSSTTSLQNYDPMAVLKATPGYMARYQQGQIGVDNMQAGRGLGARAAKEMQKYGQDFASNEYQNEFNRRFAMAGVGQQAQTAAGNWSAGQGTNLAGINTNLGNIAQQQAGANSSYYNDINNILQQGLGNYTAQQSKNKVNSQVPQTPQYSSAYDYNTQRTDYTPGSTLDQYSQG